MHHVFKCWPACLMALLSGDATCQELIARIKESTNGRDDFAESNVMQSLRRLQREGLVQSRKVQRSRRPALQWSITPPGRIKALQQLDTLRRFIDTFRVPDAQE